jgi:hypothetical protein
MRALANTAAQQGEQHERLLALVAGRAAWTGGQRRGALLLGELDGHSAKQQQLQAPLLTSVSASARSAVAAPRRGDRMVGESAPGQGERQVSRDASWTREPAAFQEHPTLHPGL